MGDISRRLALTLPVLGYLSATTPAAGQTKPGESAPDTEWLNYAGDKASTRYSPLDQIDLDNFKTLEVAWRLMGKSAAISVIVASCCLARYSTIWRRVPSASAAKTRSGFAALASPFMLQRSSPAR